MTWILSENKIFWEILYTRLYV